MPLIRVASKITFRYEKMTEEAELFRAWYRPHNERLYKLLGREPMWP